MSKEIVASKLTELETKLSSMSSKEIRELVKNTKITKAQAGYYSFVETTLIHGGTFEYQLSDEMGDVFFFDQASYQNAA